MRPELVLDAKGKQERFKKYLRRKNEERMKAEELPNELVGEKTKPLPPLQPIPGDGYPLNVFLHQMQQPRFSYPEQPTTFPSHRPPQILNIPFPIRFPMSSTKQVESNSRLLSPPPPASPCPVDLSNSPSISSAVKYLPLNTVHPEEEISKTAHRLPPLTKLHHSSVIANPAAAVVGRAPRKMCEEESVVDLAERGSSSERDEASSSKRRYCASLNQLLENSLPLHVEIKEEPGQEHDHEMVTEESLLHKYCHKKFQKAKTFTSDLRSSFTLDNSELENRKRRSVIVQAPSSKRPCSEDLRNFRISKPSCEERDGEQEYEEEPWVARYNSEEQDEEDENEEAAVPVDLSCSSSTFRSRPSSR